MRACGYRCETAPTQRAAGAGTADGGAGVISPPSKRIRAVDIGCYSARSRSRGSGARRRLADEHDAVQE
jgi:hypothetical protein